MTNSLAKAFNGSALRLFPPVLRADKPNTICKQDYMCKRAPKVKCFLHSNCLYTHIDATSPIFGDRMTEHDHQSTPWFSTSNHFTNLTFLHSSFKLQAWACTNAHKTSSIKQHTIGLLDETVKYESVFINRWGTSLQIVSLKTFTENFIYWNQTPC
jgi:hypothetical protein